MVGLMAELLKLRMPEQPWLLVQDGDMSSREVLHRVLDTSREIASQMRLNTEGLLHHLQVE